MKTIADEPIARIENQSPGLTKREYIATHIAAGLASDPEILVIVEPAIEITDALIRALNKPIAHDE